MSLTNSHDQLLDTSRNETAPSKVDQWNAPYYIEGLALASYHGSIRGGESWRFARRREEFHHATGHRSAEK
jgi:hypothetical protein